jgi:hypothetical protein
MLIPLLNAGAISLATWPGSPMCAGLRCVANFDAAAAGPGRQIGHGAAGRAWTEHLLVKRAPRCPSRQICRAALPESDSPHPVASP